MESALLLPPIFHEWKNCHFWCDESILMGSGLMKWWHVSSPLSTPYIKIETDVSNSMLCHTVNGKIWGVSALFPCQNQLTNWCLDSAPSEKPNMLELPTTLWGHSLKLGHSTTYISWSGDSFLWLAGVAVGSGNEQSMVNKSKYCGQSKKVIHSR